ncbi:CFEM domain-containing protein [Colletotrichum truncatum]|uniref:CFEM domain-containing protein n=1 Tax=Colletotrichum truncatum TaxID=5467 RepID=A0ACC3ZKC3_COLTU|nr:CFEM domain-containing protein [Colletotrichum truncatum]KAF6799961.1 CFEM domain-containing protein [Colletotrichum truncatum]
MSFPFTEFLADLPGCAAPCATDMLNVTVCAVTNLTSNCVCKDRRYIEAYRLCVRSLCVMEHVLVAKNATWTWCGFPYASEKGSVVARILVLGLTTFLFAVRQLSKFLELSQWWADDWTLILGFLFTLSFAVSRFHGYELGIGRDVWSLTAEEITRFMQVRPPSQPRIINDSPIIDGLLNSYKVFFAFEIIYTLGVGALKASILFFYIRVFKFVSNTLTAVLWSTQAFNIINCIAFTIANLNQCKPFSYAWEGWDGQHVGYCVNTAAILIAHAAINIAMDLWMLALPITQILWLNLRKRQKLEIFCMFGLGIIITVVSIIRLKVLLNFRNFLDPTHDAYYLHKWSYVELATGIIVACLPSARQVWRDMMPKLKRKLGVTPPARPRDPGESERRLKDILFISGDQPSLMSPTSAKEFASSPSSPSVRTRSECLEEGLRRHDV